MSDASRKPNRLILASSPYLLQHAYNPVDWWEWCEEAFDTARERNVPVLVSIGYSACHWCHVMERECFEQEDTARIMNEQFVCIKVDREERPDVDQIYMDAVQLLTGHGGWPLNCFVLPDKRPIHGGTYFPKKEWERQLLGVADFYRNNTEEALSFATQLTGGIRQLNGEGRIIQESESKVQIDDVLTDWSQTFDHIYGGHARAPKFPMPVNLQLFLDFGVYRNDERFTEHVHLTLKRMADGGIYDQVGGGFARYSTDIEWKVPHFEKMLYDNAQLLSLYAHAYAHQPDERYRQVVFQTIAFLKREMMSEDGLFFSALDADSEGIEGKFYVWSARELETILGSDASRYAAYYSVTETGNWEGENILHRSPMADSTDDDNLLLRCHQKLLEARNRRVRPGLDDKIITSWNALMIQGLVDCYRIFGDAEFLRMAGQTANSLVKSVYQQGKLFRIYKNGKHSIEAYSDDYALLCSAFISLFEATGKDAYAALANELLTSGIDLFYRHKQRAFAFRSKEMDSFITERFDLNDDVIPSSNSVWLKTLIRMGYLFDHHPYHEMADQMISAMTSRIGQYPSLYGNWLDAILWKQEGFRQLIICGSGEQEQVRSYEPGLMEIRLKSESKIPLVKEKVIPDYTMYYACKEKVCSLPMKSRAEAMAKMRQL